MRVFYMQDAGIQNTIACYALTPQGLVLARALAKGLGAEGFMADVFAHENLRADAVQSFHSLPLTLAQTFAQYQGHIIVGAVGLAVRCIAPLLVHKSVDPAVLVCDEAGRFVVSVLSGHVGGGNALAHRAAKIIDAEAVVTTATDAQGLPSIDMLAHNAGCTILDWDSVKVVSGALLRGERIRLYDPLHVVDMTGWEQHSIFCTAEEIVRDDGPAVFVHWRAAPEREGLLRLAVPALHVGIGCRKGVGADEIREALRTVLRQYGLEPKAVASIATVTAKADEPGICAVAQEYAVPLRVYTPEELADASVLSPSAMAAQIFGVDGVSVSEGAALLAAGNDEATLLVPKERYKECITIAVALHERFMALG